MFSQLSIIQYVGLCVFSLPISLMMIERIYILCLIIIIKSEVWTITHFLGLGHETMVWAVCLSVFFVQLCRYIQHIQNTFADEWRHYMGTFFALLVVCEGNPPVTGVWWGGALIFSLFFVNLNILCNKESSCQYFETQWSYYSLAICYMVWSIMPIHFRTASLVLRESYKYYCPTASEIIRNNMDQ